MPQIPGENNQAPQFSTQVPGAALPRRQEFAQYGEAADRLGQSVESTAAKGNEIYDEISRQHDISTASKAAVDGEVSHAQQLQTMKLQSPDGFIHDEDTGEITKNSDGSQRTLSQEYWDWANGDYQDRQKDMSPRAAAMFRQQMLPHIGENTKILQGQQLELQRKSADTDISSSMMRYSQDNDRTPYPDSMPYYQEKNADGSINLRGNTFKINSQLSTIKLWSQRQGSSGDNVGMYNSAQAQAMGQERMSEHANNWVRSAVTDILENDTPRDHKNRVSTTAYQQVLNLRDVIEGKDPQSLDAKQKGTPSVNSSLTSDQADKWRSQLNSMLDGAKKIDRSDYELQLQQMKEATKTGKYQNFDTLVNSPEFGYLIHAGEPLGYTPEEQVKNLSEVFGNAAKSAGHNGVNDLASDATKRGQVDENLKSFELGFPQWASMHGVKYTGAMGNAILGDAKKTAYTELEQESKKFHEDPADFAAQMSSGVSNKPRSPMMSAVHNQIANDASAMAPLMPMAGGKTPLENGFKAMTPIYARAFDKGQDVIPLSRSDYQAWAGRIKNLGPEQVEGVFQKLRDVSGEDKAKASLVMDQLVKVGGLDPRYQTEAAQPTPELRKAGFASIIAGKSIIQAAADKSGQKPEDIDKTIRKILQPHADVLNRIYSGDATNLAEQLDGLNETGRVAYSAAINGGASKPDAEKAVQDKIARSIPGVGATGNPHSFLGFDWTTGASAPVKFSRTDLGDDDKKAIQQNLQKAQEELRGYQNFQIVKPKVADGAYDFGQKLDGKWLAEHPYVWAPVQTKDGPAYRLKYSGMNADGSANGDGYFVRVFANKNTVDSFYEVKESDALKRPSK